MSTDLNLQENKMLSVSEVKDQINSLQRIMKKVMIDGIHYGKIDGCDKPSLWKAGSEVLLTTFRISIKPVVEDLSVENESKFRVITNAYDRDGNFLGAGVGQASSFEEKYKWRKAKCEKEYDLADEEKRRIKYYKYKNEVMEIQQIMTDAADKANTILKMAKKRSQVDVTLTITAASDIFTQDIDESLEIHNTPTVDIPNYTVEEKTEKPEEKKAEEKPKYGELPGCINAKQHGLLMFKMNELNIPLDFLREKIRELFSLDSTWQLTTQQLNNVLDWLQTQKKAIE
ncbi:MAG: hypothetical protein GY756_09890 [bacterium]|nr:hypothetical protein [bacterium]